MSQVFKCDITDEIVVDPVVAVSKWVVRSVNRTINGKLVKVSILLEVDAFAGAQPTHLSDAGRRLVVVDVKRMIDAITGEGG